MSGYELCGGCAELREKVAESLETNCTLADRLNGMEHKLSAATLEITRLTEDTKCAWQNNGILERARQAADAEVARLKTADKQLAELREDHATLARMLSRYAHEVPLGHQPHMLAEPARILADAALARSAES